MTIFTEGARTAEFIQSLANGYRSIGTAEFDSTTNWAGEAIPAGQVYAVVGGVTVAWDGDASDGSEVAAGVLYEGVDAGETKDRAVVVRDAVLKRYKLVADGTEAELDAALLALGIVVAD